MNSWQIVVVCVTALAGVCALVFNRWVVSLTTAMLMVVSAAVWFENGNQPGSVGGVWIVFALVLGVITKFQKESS